MAISLDSSSRHPVKPFAAFLIALLVVLLAGVIDLRKPFSGDQALFVTGARAMRQGSLLYRDFWDLKQPGIYWFYWLGIHMPGSPEVAVHSLELLYFLVFAGVMVATLRNYFHHPATAALASVLCCGVYYAICGSWHLTQVEGLVGFPLYLSAWLLLKKPASQPLAIRSIFLAGMAAAIVMLLKLLLGFLPVCFLLLLIVANFYHDKSVFKSFLAILVFGIGAFVVLFPVLLYYESNDQLILIYTTFIEYPARITRELPHNNLMIVKGGLIWFVTRMGPLILLGFVGAWKRANDLLGRGMILWIIAGFGLIILQRMGWTYHFLLLLCPLAILAAAGTEAIILGASSRANSQIVARAQVTIPILILFPYVGVEGIQVLRNLHDTRPGVYALTAGDVATLTAPQARPGPIYVIGDPLIYYLSGRTQAIAINGWSPEWLLDNQWDDLTLRLKAKRPPYIFVNYRDNPSVESRGQAFTGMLNDYYHQATKTQNGVWYEVGRKP